MKTQQKTFEGKIVCKCGGNPQFTASVFQGVKSLIAYCPECNRTVEYRIAFVHIHKEGGN